MSGSVSSLQIPHQEQAPQSEEEWAQQLGVYAKDRELPGSSSRSNSQSTSQQQWAAVVPPPQDPHVRPLVHHGDSDESIERGKVPFVLCNEEDHARNQVEPATLDINPPFEGITSSDPSSGVSPPIEPTPIAFDTAKTAEDDKDKNNDHDDDDTRSASAERARLRAFYEAEGWLPGPQPCKTTRLRRRRAIRRLGLVGEEQDGRRMVLSRYAEMAQLIFNVSRAVVAIIHDEQEYVYHADPEISPEHCPTAETACSHVVGLGVDACWVISDWSKDWRTRKNPTCLKSDFKFFAAAPLRYHGRDGSTVDFGTLNIYDTVSRDVFDERERLLLQKLSNMLVYQLATLQSEYMAKRSSAMYDASITFLQRSIMPASAGRQEGGRSESRAESRRPSERKRQPESASVPPVRQASPPRGPTEPPTLTTHEEQPKESASKLGPTDGRAARRKAMLSDQSLFTDAAETLRALLKADSIVVVNMEDFQLFIKKVKSSVLDNKKGKDRLQTKENIIHDYMEGKPWPSEVEPVVTYTGDQGSVQVLGSSSGTRETQYHFDEAGVETTLSEFLKTYLQTRQFWWDREDSSDDLSRRVMALMPRESQTAMGTAFLGSDGKVRFAMFATWNHPPSSLVDSSMIALPFVWILGGCLMAALAMKKMRALEASQISYSNLQAHELRTPLHQILAITQLLRSSMNDLAEPRAPEDPTKMNEQIRDLLPFLDAIDTSGKTLHGIVDNILSFLDLKSRESSQSVGGATLLTSPQGSPNSLEVMFEELLRDAIDEDRKSRRANGQASCHIETVFEIIPPLLGEEVLEDAGGALRRALSKVIANAYKFIDHDGCVEIYVDDVPDLLPPEGCENIALTRRVSIVIKDNGKGMDQTFVNERLGEPWAKEDRYATGSGLSVHLAYSIIDLMGGCMEITSTPGKGTTVQIDVSLPVRSIPFPELSESHDNSRRSSSASVAQLQVSQDQMHVSRRVALVGMDREVPLQTLGTALKRQYAKLGCEIVGVSDAELIICNGDYEEDEEKGTKLFEEAETSDIVFLVIEDHSASRAVLHAAEKHGKKIRRFKKPTTPSILRETLFPNHSQKLQDLRGRSKEGDDDGSTPNAVNTPNMMGPEGEDQGPPTGQGYRPSYDRYQSWTASISSARSDPSSAPTSASRQRGAESVTDAIASLSMGEYFPPMLGNQDRLKDFEQEVQQSAMSVRPHDRQQGEDAEEEQSGSSVSPCDTPVATVATAVDSGTQPLRLTSSDPHSEAGHELPETVDQSKEETELVNVLVVEDNKINRTILVKILSVNKTIKVLEAEDGDVAVNMFRELTGAAIVLLDINMPRKDGYQACVEMRGIEKELAHRPRAEIIAVTALASDEQRQHGLVECSFDEWHTKPCGKAQITKIVEQAIERLKRA
ncbi:hypothetical protein IAU60_003468 [Kwoniella sp. DSM 27419]